MKKGAITSECGRYRFTLHRFWDESKPNIHWNMHNPSTADAKEDDPTIRRIIGFSKLWGYGGIIVTNLSPYRCTNPKDMVGKPFEELFPLQNINYINEAKKCCSLHIQAHGNPIIKDSKPALYDDCWHYLKLTKSGNPCHPLYLRSDLKPQPINKEIK